MYRPSGLNLLLRKLPSAEEAVTKLSVRYMRWNEDSEIQVPEARNSLAWRGAPQGGGGTPGKAENQPEPRSGASSFVTPSSTLGAYLPIHTSRLQPAAHYLEDERTLVTPRCVLRPIATQFAGVINDVARQGSSVSPRPALRRDSSALRQFDGIAWSYRLGATLTPMFSLKYV